MTFFHSEIEGTAETRDAILVNQINKHSKEEEIHITGL